MTHSRDDFLDHISDDIGQPEGPAVVLEGQLFLVESHQVQYRRVQVIHVNLVFDAVVTKIVGDAVCDAGFHATSAHPHREAEMIVLAFWSLTRLFVLWCVCGVRPKSPSHSTSVSSNCPRALRLLSRPASGLSLTLNDQQTGFMGQQ
jgi:hypothetical protein